MQRSQKSMQSFDVPTAVMLKVCADSCFEFRVPVSVDGFMCAKKKNAISGSGENFR
jgi:hypothetical protein